tara:strand:- start:928 stop:3480 length:2553 start_codon:yes stop_codon:yes gene_type:complete
MRLLSSILTLCVVSTVWAQFTEDFSDGDFTINPTWSGNVAKFTIENEELRSNSNDVSDLFYLSTASSAAQGDLEWRFRVNMKLNTSGANYTDVFLMADKANLSTVTTGYFLRIGNTKDEISLYKIVAGTETQLTDGSDNKTHNKNIRIKVTKGAFGSWAVSADYLGGEAYELEGTAIDNDVTSNAYFGFLIKQSTTSFHLKHYFDDIYVGNLIVDTQKPAILTTIATNKNTISLSANEAVNTLGTVFSLNKGYGSPDNVVENRNEITLSYTNNLVNDNYELTIKLLSDLAGNRLDTVVKFSYLQLEIPQAGDVLINEIFADPTPKIGLPGAEYVEIVNYSTHTFNLENCTFSDGGTPASLPKSQIAPGDYALLVKDGTEVFFAAYTNVIPVSGFPALNNSGDALELKNANGELLDAVTYTDDFYRNSDKKDGGYALERISFVSDCSAASNWIASTAPSGGTPSVINSVFGKNPDNTAPQLLGAIIIGSNNIELLLNEEPTGTFDFDITNFTLEPSSEQPTNVIFTQAINTITLTFASTLEVNTIYQLRIASLEDCVGNSRTDINTELVSTSPAVMGDLLINELLFNPKEDGVDFIEIYNASKKYIDLSTLSVARYTDEREIEVDVSPNKEILYPREYVAICIDSNAIKTAYKAARNLVQLKSLPPMSNDDGTILLLDYSGSVLDSVRYSEDQHFALLSDVNGVSLERINFEGKSYDPSKWHSASASVGFATPGYENSQFVDVSAVEGKIHLQRNTFSPDADGYEDLLIISYDLNTNGTVLNGYVYDLAGRLIYQPVNNKTLSSSGFVSWDGIIENGTKIPVGNYIILLEAFNLDGKTSRKKLAFSVLGNF